MKDFSIPEGIYELMVVDIEDTVSRSGKDMWVITYRAQNNGSDRHTLKDYVLKGDDFLWKRELIEKKFGAPLSELLGKRCNGLVETRTFQSEKYGESKSSYVSKLMALPKDKPTAEIPFDLDEPLNDDIPF